MMCSILELSIVRTISNFYPITLNGSDCSSKLFAVIPAPNKNNIFKTKIFAEESLDAGPEGGPNFAEILNKALPDSDHSSCDSQSDRSSNSGEVRFLDSWSMTTMSRRRRGGVEEVVMHYLYCYLPCPQLRCNRK